MRLWGSILLYRLRTIPHCFGGFFIDEGIAKMLCNDILLHQNNEVWLMKILEMIYVVIYFFVVIVAGIILYPLSFLINGTHYEENGYDYWQCISLWYNQIDEKDKKSFEKCRIQIYPFHSEFVLSVFSTKNKIRWWCIWELWEEWY